MNQRAALRAAGSIALIVLTTSSTTTDCEREGWDRERSDSRERSSSQVVVRADDNTCWKVTVDDRTHRGCGDATFYGHGSGASGRTAKVEKVDGDHDVRVSLIVDGRTVDRGTSSHSGQKIDVRQRG